MKAFLQVLLIFSCGIFLLTSCSPIATKGYTRQPLPENRFKPVFQENFEKSLYTANFIFGEQSLSGIAIIKHIERKESFRMVCMAETGLKYFDLEFFPVDSSVVHYMMDALNRKKIVGLLTEDLGLIFKSGLNENKTAYYESENSTGGFAFSQKNRGCNYFYYQKENQPPEKIIRRAFLSTPAEVEIDYDTTQIPIGIIITYGQAKATMEFKLIPKR